MPRETTYDQDRESVDTWLRSYRKVQRAGQAYEPMLFKEIVKFGERNGGLDPCYLIRIGDDRQSVQFSHCTAEQMLAVPGLADTKWRYWKTTFEMIDIFIMERDHDPAEFFDWEPERLSDGEVMEDGTLWVTPKGQPREQWGGAY